MKHRKRGKITDAFLLYLFIITFLFGCSGHGEKASEGISGKLCPKEIVFARNQENTGAFLAEIIENASHKNEAPESEIVEEDWSQYFKGMNGAAVVYDISKGSFMIYHEELAMVRRSPCSTFKIISSLIALENGILDPDDSVRAWSGEIFWNEKWNRDIDFAEAFQTSCVWYFREIIDEIGKDRMKAGLEKISYGNCDISDWEGQQNTNNHNRALTGFWIESSLKISPKEQTEVMARIFESDTDYSADTINSLKQVMLVEEPISEQNGTDLSIYGKTGMGKAQGITVDAWFTGFAETPDGNLYFCVYLGQTDGMDVTSLGAKEIALRILEDYPSLADYPF